MIYLGLIGLTFVGFSRVPAGFVPTQDKEYLVAFAQLPDAASLDRTEAVIRRMSAMALEHPGVANAVAFPGLSINGFVNAPNAGIVFVTLKPLARATLAGAVSWRHRRCAERPLREHAGGLRRDLPAARGSRAGSSRRLQAVRRGSRQRRLRGAVLSRCKVRCRRLSQAPTLMGLFSSFQVNVPQIDTDVDRERVKTYGVPLTSVFDTLQVYLGLAVRQRLQSIWPHLSGERASRVVVPHAA